MDNNVLEKAEEAIQVMRARGILDDKPFISLIKGYAKRAGDSSDALRAIADMRSMLVYFKYLSKLLLI